MVDVISKVLPSAEDHCARYTRE